MIQATIRNNSQHRTALKDGSPYLNRASIHSRSKSRAVQLSQTLDELVDLTGGHDCEQMKLYILAAIWIIVHLNCFLFKCGFSTIFTPAMLNFELDPFVKSESSRNGQN